MARHGRGFPLSTQYTALSRVVPSNPLSGSATFDFAAAGSLTLITAPEIAAAETVEHKFRHVQTPSFGDFAEVQRYLQRTFDEVAQAVNAVRSVSEGGTGLGSFAGIGVLRTSSPGQLALIPLAVGTLQSDGVTVAFAPGGAGEANTASNVNLTGVGVWKQKVGVDLQFRGIAAASSKIVVVLDAPNNAITINVSEANLVLGSIGGSLVIGQVPNDLITYAKIQNVTATSRLLGRSTAGAGDIEELSLGAGLSLVAGVLSSSGGAGSNMVDRTPAGNVALAADESLVVVGEYNLGANELFIPASAEVWIR